MENPKSTRHPSPSRYRSPNSPRAPSQHKTETPNGLGKLRRSTLLSPSDLPKLPSVAQGTPSASGKLPGVTLLSDMDAGSLPSTLGEPRGNRGRGARAFGRRRVGGRRGGRRFGVWLHLLSPSSPQFVFGKRNAALQRASRHKAPQINTKLHEYLCHTWPNPRQNHPRAKTITGSSSAAAEPHEPTIGQMRRIVVHCSWLTHSCPARKTTS